MSFEDILDKPATEIDRPKPLPVGSYIWSVQGMPRVDKSKEKQTPFYEYTVKCVAPMDDVDEDALKEWATKADGTMRSLTEFTQKLTFYITPDSVYRLQEFIQHCNIDADDMSTKEAAQNLGNSQFVGFVTHAASKDGTTVYANISRTAPVED